MVQVGTHRVINKTGYPVSYKSSFRAGLLCVVPTFPASLCLYSYLQPQQVKFIPGRLFDVHNPVAMDLAPDAVSFFSFPAGPPSCISESLEAE